MQPILLSGDELQARFKLSTRQSTRVLALMAKGVGVSALVVELLATDAPLANLLLDRELLANAGETISAELLSALQEKHGAEYFAATPLAIANVTGGAAVTPAVVVCFEEELLAESVQLGVNSPPSPSPIPPSAASPTSSAPAASLPPSEAVSGGLVIAAGPGAVALPSVADSQVAALFSPHDLARLRLVLLTSTNPAEKKQAIRTLRLVPMDANEKGALLMRALQDESPEVRAEAAASLTTVGLSERIADAVTQLSTGSETERETAQTTLRLLAEKARHAELGVIVAVLIGTLAGGGSAGFIENTLVSLAEMAPKWGPLDAPLRDLDRQLARLIATRYDELARPTYAVYRACENSATLRELVRQNFADAPTDRARTFYLSLLAELDPTDDVLLACVDEMAQRAAMHELDPSTARLATALRGFGRRAVDALLGQIETVDDDTKETILSILASVFYGTSLTVEIVDPVGEKLATIYPLSRPQVRLAIVENPFVAHPSMSPGIRARLARVIFDDLHEHKLERVGDELQSVLRRLGPAILPELRKTVTNAKQPITRLRAVHVAGLIATDFHSLHFPGETGDLQSYLAEEAVRGRMGIGPTPELQPEAWRLSFEGGQRLGAPLPRPDAPPVDRAVAAELCETLEVFRGLLADEHFPDKGPLYATIGRIASCGCVPSDTLDELVEFLSDRVRSSSYTYSVIEALAYLIGARDLSPATRTELAHLFERLVQMKLPDRLSTVKETPDGKVYVLEHETTAYTELIPRVLLGLNRLALTRAAEEGMRDHIVDTLLAVWNDIVEFRVIWGPQNTIDLARILGQIAMSDLVPQSRKNTLLEALLRKAESLTVIALLGELIESGPDSPQMAALAHDLFHTLQDYLLNDEFAELEERRTILVSMCRIAARPTIGDSPTDAVFVRESVVNFCTTAIRDWRILELAKPLWRLATLPTVTPELAEEIKRRLARFNLLPATALTTPSPAVPQ